MSNGVGSVADTNVANITVHCPLPLRHAIGGSVSGLRGSGMVLQNADNGETLPVAADGSFVFGTQLNYGAHYNVGIKTQPGLPGQACTVGNGAGSVGNNDIVNIAITCPAAMHYAYVTSLTNTAVYKIDEATGALTATGSVVSQGGILAGVHPAGSRFFYLADVVQNAVHAYTIDAATGALTEIAGSPFASGASQPQGLAATPDGRFLYAANRAGNSITTFAIDAATGALALVGTPVPSGAYPLNAAVTPDGRFLFIANYQSNAISRYAIDAVSGIPTRLSDAPMASNMRFLAIDGCSRFLYATPGSDNKVNGFAIDGSGGLASVPGAPFAAGNGTQNMAIDPGAHYLYVTNETDGTLSSFAINAASGALTAVAAPVSVGTYPEGVDVDPNGKFVYAADQGGGAIVAFRLDPASGVPSAPLRSPTSSLPIGILILNQ